MFPALLAESVRQVVKTICLCSRLRSPGYYVTVRSKISFGFYCRWFGPGSEPSQRGATGPETERFHEVTSFPARLSATKVLWIPDPHGTYPDFLATSGDCLRIFSLQDEGKNVRMECTLSNVPSKSDRSAMPLTSFDWNETDLALMVTGSLDNCCTVWSLETGQIVGQTGKSGNGKINLIS